MTTTDTSRTKKVYSLTLLKIMISRKIKKKHFLERKRWQRSRWPWSTSLSTDISGIHLQAQKCMQNTSREWTGIPDQWKKNIQNHTKLGRRKEIGGKIGVLVGLDLLVRWGN